MASSINLGEAITVSGAKEMNCPDCNGTGRDARKTASVAAHDAEFRHRVKHHGSYIGCWTCNGNGIEAPYPGEPYPSDRPTVTSEAKK